MLLYCAKIMPFAFAWKSPTRAWFTAVPGGEAAASSGKKHRATLPVTLTAASAFSSQLRVTKLY